MGLSFGGYCAGSSATALKKKLWSNKYSLWSSLGKGFYLRNSTRKKKQMFDPTQQKSD